MFKNRYLRVFVAGGVILDLAALGAGRRVVARRSESNQVALELQALVTWKDRH